MFIFTPHVDVLSLHGNRVFGTFQTIFSELCLEVFDYIIQNVPKPKHNAFFLVFYNISSNSFLNILSLIQGLQHEDAYERTISIVCFARDNLSVSTTKKGRHKRGPKER